MPDLKHINFVSKRPMYVVLLLLSCVSGSIDAIGYFKLGNVFTANMTGNTVLLGIALGNGQMEPAIRSLAALAGFVVGVFAGSALISYQKKGWETTLAVSLIIEFFLILLVALFWWFLFNEEHSFVVFASIIVSAIAMVMVKLKPFLAFKTT